MRRSDRIPTTSLRAVLLALLFVAVFVAVSLVPVLPTTALAVPLAEWSFEDGTANDALGNYHLTPMGGGPSISGGVASFAGDGGYLEASGFGGNPTWTLALGLTVDVPFDQGIYQGIFSNNSSSSASYSWQVESFDGIYQFRTMNGVYVIGAPTGGLDTIVVRKLDSGDADIWFNGSQVVASLGSNPGGLQNFRIGTNRNTTNFYAFDLDFARVYDSVENPSSVVPEPGSALLLAIGLVELAIRRRAPARDQRTDTI